MILKLRKLSFALPLALSCGLGLMATSFVTAPAEAQSRSKNAKKPLQKKATEAAARPRKAGSKRSTRNTRNKPASETGNRPKLASTHQAWGAYVASAGTKTCYALSKPRKREPARLKRDPGFIFIATRPRQGIRNEISITMGYDTKKGSEPEVRVGGAKFEMVSKGSNLWIKNAAEERALLAAMRSGSSLTVHVTSLRGNKTVDTYSLAGLSQALARVQKDCK